MEVKSTNKQINESTSLLLLLSLLFFSCKSAVSTVIFHTDMGKMTVRILPGLSAEASAALEQLQAAKPDSLAISKVLHDGYIQLNFSGQNLEASQQPFAPLSGNFVWSAGKFYIIQGRKYTDVILDKWEQANGHKIAPALRQHLKQKGGTLALPDRGIVLGTLCDGKEVLDRIAALPHSADGKPLRTVSVRLESSR